MNKQETLARLVRGVRTDIQDYQQLRSLLEAQFQAALRHDTVRIGELATDITDIVETLERSRRDRVYLASQLLDEHTPATVPALMLRLPPAVREVLHRHWALLEGLVRDCKALNTRNCELMVEQHAVMQRVLHGEGSIYVDA